MSNDDANKPEPFTAGLEFDEAQDRARRECERAVLAASGAPNYHELVAAAYSRRRAATVRNTAAYLAACEHYERRG